MPCDDGKDWKPQTSYKVVIGAMRWNRLTAEQAKDKIRKLLDAGIVAMCVESE